MGKIQSYAPWAFRTLRTRSAHASLADPRPGINAAGDQSGAPRDTGPRRAASTRCLTPLKSSGIEVAE